MMRKLSHGLMVSVLFLSIFAVGCAVSGDDSRMDNQGKLATLRTRVRIPDGKWLAYDRTSGEKITDGSSEAFELWVSSTAVDYREANDFIFTTLGFYPSVGLWPVAVRGQPIDMPHIEAREFSAMEEYFGDRSSLYANQTWKIAEAGVGSLVRENNSYDHFLLFLVPTSSPLSAASGFLEMEHHALLPFASYPMGPVVIDNGLPYYIVPDDPQAVVPQRVVNEVSLAIGDEPEPDDIFETRVFPFYYTN